MNLIETYNGSGLYAQYATSADYASNGQALSAALTAVPNTYLQNTDLATADGKVTAISGIPLSAGGDVPEGVMVESAVEYNAVNEISGYNGSAIAQYGAEKQWLVHDDTLVHAANSAQYALGCNISALQRLMGIDETVLWSGSMNTTAQTAALSESLANFEYVEMYAYPSTAYTGQRAAQGRKFITLSGDTNTFYHIKTDNIESNVYYGEDMYINIAGTALNLAAGCRWTGNTYTSAVTAYRGALTKVIGIGRKS